MKYIVSEKMRRLTRLLVEIDNLYHQFAVKIGMSDSALLTLYTLCENEGRCDLSIIYKQTGASKQTINSSLRKLEKEGIVYLENKNGREKAVVLTEYGSSTAANDIYQLFAIENDIISDFSDEDINAYIEFNQKYADLFREKIKTNGDNK